MSVRNPTAELGKTRGGIAEESWRWPAVWAVNNSQRTCDGISLGFLRKRKDTDLEILSLLQGLFRLSFLHVKLPLLKRDANLVQAPSLPPSLPHIPGP